jgi:membrane-associated phospholipid phosphatase
MAIAESFARFDITVAAWFRAHMTPGPHAVLSWLTELGSPFWIAVALAGCIVYLCARRHWRGLFLLLLTVPIGMLLNEYLKFYFHRTRPFPADTQWTGYSFPSGHANGAMLLYGLLMLAILPSFPRRKWRILTILLSVFLIFLIGFTRIALGAHYLSDVAGGIAFGGIWLTLCSILCGARQRSAT